MTASDADRVIHHLNLFRYEAGERLARLEERIEANERNSQEANLSARVAALEIKAGTVGKFTWADVYRSVGAVAASVSILGGVMLLINHT